MEENYSEFAKVYTARSYPAYSRFMAERLPDILGRLDYRAKSILDLACGEGTFALEAEKLGFDLTGVDKSEEMVEIAREKAEEAGAGANFLRGDMRELSLRGDEFDLVTSWKLTSPRTKLAMYSFFDKLIKINFDRFAFTVTRGENYGPPSHYSLRF